MDDGLSTEILGDPSVECEIGVRRCDILTVIDIYTIIGHTTIGLKANEDVAFHESGDDSHIIDGVDLSGCTAPILQHLLGT